MLETIVNQIQTTRDITKEQLNIVLSASEEEVSCLYQAAREVSQKVYGNRIYIRGLIEFSNYCKNNCYYCGIRLDNPKVCRYMDIPLQHISDKVLSNMHRNVNGAWTRELIAKMRSRVPGVVLRTTMIVGHPGEGKKDFAELLDFVGQAAFQEWSRW